MTELPKYRHIRGNRRAKLAADLKREYENGVSIRALAARTGRSHGFVHQILIESGVRLRPRGRAPRTA